jgi:hypothetical protein
MGPDDGDWVRDEATRPAGGEEADGGGGWAGDGWAEQGYGAPPAWAGAGRGHGGAPGFSVRAAAVVAVLAAAAGIAAGLFLVRGAPAASAGATPSVSAGGLPGTGQLEMMLSGRVLAVSGTSITIGGSGPSVTAAVTGTTKVTGTARGIGGVKAGDEVSAQISGTPGHLAATAIQDPAQ